jgi:YHS domain-containing protein
MKKISFLLILSVWSIIAIAQKEIFTKEGDAINRYDAVAYFTEGKAVPGETVFTFQWKDARWFFASQKNLDAFKKDPEKYAPQFGGYCAYGMSRGYKAQTSPDAWTVVDGKLYLNYNVEVRELWNKDQPAMINKANANWPTVKNKE